MKFVVLALALIVSQVKAFDIEVKEGISVTEFKSLMEDSSIEKIEFPARASHVEDATRKGSRVYFLFGHLEAQFTNYEYSMALNAIRALQNAGWTVAADGSTSKSELQRYVADHELAAFFWSSHGTKEGYLTSPAPGGKVEGIGPKDFTLAGKNLRLAVLCACYSAVQNNAFSSSWNKAQVYGYQGLTTPQNCGAILQYQFIPLFNKYVY